jgi:phosphate transport system permease protein
MKKWFSSGNAYIWMVSGAVSISMIIVIGLLFLIAINGLGYFWPKDVWELNYQDRSGKTIKLIGELHNEERISAKRLQEAGIETPPGQNFVTRYLLKVGNREFGNDFRWIEQFNIENKEQGIKTPEKLLVVERLAWGNLYGNFVALKEKGKVVAKDEPGYIELLKKVSEVSEKRKEIEKISRKDVGEINSLIEQLRLDERKLELDKRKNETTMKPLLEKKKILEEQFKGLQKKLDELNAVIKIDSIDVQLADGKIVDVPLGNITKVYEPNSFTIFEKIIFYAHKFFGFLYEEPREANTEGGIFPAIFGTVVLVMIMSIIVTPFGIIAAIYLREYAKQGPFVRLLRIAINNLAGVPSVVYGVFGLGFFVYFLGGNIDRIFFPESLPHPTLGAPCLLWSAVTLALLTLPVVIVSTEEGLARVPITLREGSLALGATKFETLWRVILPLVSPAMITGLILAVARAAGEVAPLMLVGVVKLAPSLPLDGSFPFVHFDRKFMHMGFHIHDIGFQSPNVDATKPLVYATAFILVALIFLLNFAAITIRNHLREKYKALGSL